MEHARRPPRYGDRTVDAAAITPGGEREARDAHRIVDVNVMGTIAALDDYLAWSRSVDDFWIDSTVVDRTPLEERPS